MNEPTDPQTSPQPEPAPHESPSPHGTQPYGGVHYGAPYYGGPAAGAGPLSSFDPLRLLLILRRRWRTILLVVLFMGCAATFRLSKAPRIYQVRALIELSARRPRILNQQAAVIEDPASIMQFEQTLNTQIAKLNSPILFPFVLACYRQANPDDRTPEDELRARLRGTAGFSSMGRTRLVAVTFRHTDPAFAARACNAFAAGAEASAREENRAASEAAVAWLGEQATVQKHELESADRALFDVRQSCNMDVLEGQRKTVQDALLSFNRALVDVESQATKERQMLDALNSADLQPENAGKLPAAIPRGNEVDAALARWRAAIAERTALLSRCTPEHPMVVAKDKAIVVYREQAVAALNRARTTTSSNLELFNKQADSLRRKKEEQSKLASDLERDILDREMKLTVLERERRAADGSYQGILFRMQEARLSADENTASVKLVEAATAPARPVSPRVMRIVLLALLLGVAGGAGLALIIEALEDHVVGVQDIEAGMGVKVLAVVPHVKSANRKDVAAASFTHRFSEVAEAFAGLRSVLDSPTYREQSRVIVVTSSLPEEGKTTTCCNLATTCARNGERTLLIDFDLRRPRIVSIYPMPPGQEGLLAHLAGLDTAAARLVYAADCPNLSVIASRPAKDASPAELVGGKKVTELIAWARANFDRVILDAPPLGMVSDALVLGGLADCVLVMARPATSRRRALRHTIQRLTDVGIGAIATVLNDVDLSSFAGHGYGPYYHYRKHYKSYHDSAPETSVS